MKKNQQNLMLCGMVFAVSLVIANVVTAKTIQTGIPLFGSTIALPGAAVCYAVTFLMTDVVGEIWGRKEAQTIVYWGFACQILATCLILLTQALPAVDPTMQAAYDMLLVGRVHLPQDSRQGARERRQRAHEMALEQRLHHDEPDNRHGSVHRNRVRPRLRVAVRPDHAPRARRDDGRTVPLEVLPRRIGHPDFLPANQGSWKNHRNRGGVDVPNQQAHGNRWGA